MMFVLVVTLMVLVAVGLVTWPLLRQHTGLSRAAAGAVAEQKRRLAKLDAELAKGALSTADYLKARVQAEAELQARLEKQPRAAATGAVQAVPWKTGLVASLALVVLVVGVYLRVGNWRLAFVGERTVVQSSEAQMVASLARRLASADSQNADDWVMLGRSYVVLGRYHDAVAAYARAYKLRGDGDANLLAGYAEAMILDDPAQLTGQAAPLLEKALQEAPRNPEALWYAGMLAQAEGNTALAAKRWQTILANNPPAGIREFVTQHLAALGAAAASRPAGTSTLRVPVRVALAPGLKTRIPPGAALFVFAGPFGAGKGPPLLAKRLAVSSWPVNVTLTASDRMLSGASLDTAEPIQVTARLSLDGAASPHAGDLEGSARLKLAGATRTAYITIDRVLP